MSLRLFLVLFLFLSVSFTEGPKAEGNKNDEEVDEFGIPEDSALIVTIGPEDSKDTIRQKVIKALGNDAKDADVEKIVNSFMDQLGKIDNAADLNNPVDSSGVPSALIQEALAKLGAKATELLHGGGGAMGRSASSGPGDSDEDDDDGDDGFGDGDKERAKVPGSGEGFAPDAESAKGGVYAKTPSSSTESTAAKDLVERARDLVEGKDADGKEVPVNIPQAIALFEQAIAMGSGSACFHLAELHFHGKHVDRNLDEAARLYQLGAQRGDPYCQTNVAMLHASRRLPGASDALALLGYHFAAKGGDEAAMMALGFRYNVGLGVAKNCASALAYYSAAASSVASEHTETIVSPMIEKARLEDEEKAASLKQPVQDDDDVVNYYQYSAARGDAGAQAAMGQLHLYGARGLPQDPVRAAEYFTAAAKAGDASAMSHLGMMYSHGDGVTANNETSFKYYSQCAEKNSPSCFNGLGFHYLHGSGTERDVDKAIHYFKLSSARGNAEGSFNLGAIYIGGIGVRKDHAKALANFLLAGQQGHTLALYNLGVMYANGLGSPRSCRTALMYFKAVAERASWTKALGEAQKMHRAGDSEGALLVYERFAEMGFEVAQSNAAYLLRKLHPSPSPSVLQRISRLLTRASLQGSLDATVRLGDMYYSGEGAPLDLTKAASLYQKAAGSKNPEAMFNLGAMHHFGLGLPKDLHLAKRFYDMAGATSDEASYPVALALASLRVATFMETFEYKGLRWDDCAIVALSISTFALIMTRILRLRGFFS